SDIYAMGGRPLFALNIVAFPANRLPMNVLGEILLGAQEVAVEAGIDIIGGHTVDDTEPKFGLAVTGVVHPKKVWRNVGATPGDVLVLTKPIGVGILSTAMKRGLLDDRGVERATAVMRELNRGAAMAADKYAVHACTDITGFGLLGHLGEMARGSKMDLQLNWESVPLIEGAWDQAASGVVPGGTQANLQYATGFTDFAADVPEIARLLLADAQTSGGLVFALPAAEAESLIKELRKACKHTVAVIGTVVAEGEGRIQVV
ncbi:selenide, water dikinase SelD, partial [candidate division KSB1 bacterium]|nr:selenide, water dikinase SelD [candidate division KSB1 bacterium]